MKKHLLVLALSCSMPAFAAVPVPGTAALERFARALPAGQWTGVTSYGKQPCLLDISYAGNHGAVLTLKYVGARGKNVEDRQVFDARSRDVEIELDLPESVEISRSVVLQRDGDRIVTATNKVTAYLEPGLSSVSFAYLEHDGENDPHESQVSCEELRAR